MRNILSAASPTEGEKPARETSFRFILRFEVSLHQTQKSFNVNKQNPLSAKCIKEFIQIKTQTNHAVMNSDSQVLGSGFSSGLQFTSEKKCQQEEFYFGEQESRSFTCNIGCRKHQMWASVCIRKETVIAIVSAKDT